MRIHQKLINTVHQNTYTISNQINEMNFPYKPDYLCRFCGYESLCLSERSKKNERTKAFSASDLGNLNNTPVGRMRCPLHFHFLRLDIHPIFNFYPLFQNRHWLCRLRVQLVCIPIQNCIHRRRGRLVDQHRPHFSWQEWPLTFKATPSLNQSRIAFVCPGQMA